MKLANINSDATTGARTLAPSTARAIYGGDIDPRATAASTVSAPLYGKLSDF